MLRLHSASFIMILSAGEKLPSPPIEAKPFLSNAYVGAILSLGSFLPNLRLKKQERRKLLPIRKGPF